MTNIKQLYQLYKQHPVICTDTRKIMPGCLFFALKGDKFDANTFAEQAIEAGAAYAIIDNAKFKNSDRFLLVNDVLGALQQLARHHREQLTIPVIGLTGSNGKTTSKELINAVLSQQFNTYATQGNLNNHIGVPLTILSINNTHEAAVIEMGANHQKEIELLSSISRPGYGLITNVGKAHLEGFGGTEGVKKGKGELYDFLKKHHGITFINHDSPALLEMAANRGLTDVYYYGKTPNPANMVTGSIIENAPFLKLRWSAAEGESHEVETHVTGEYNLDNVLAAISIGLFFKLSPQQINAGIAGYQPTNNRSQIVQTPSNTLICDYYNANPSSMAVAIENLGLISAEKKALILGDMFEMGDESEAEHLAIIKRAMDTPIDIRIFIGKEFAHHTSAFKSGATFYTTTDDAITALKASPIKHATVLIKGSRGMALERLATLF